MKLKKFIKSFNSTTLIEVVDGEYRRIYWGETMELLGDKYAIKFLASRDVVEANLFEAQTSESGSEPAMQIIVDMNRA